MKLLILTQKVDENDDLLGFFHNWIKEFSKHYEKIIVVCLGVGKYDLPSNVKVLSLGKEVVPLLPRKGEGWGDGVKVRLKYIFNFYKYIWQERKNYDKIFVHMNIEYVLLGVFIWKILGKDIYLWYNHQYAGILARTAFLFSKKIFHTSPFAYTARYKKSEIMPAGIDTEIFQRDLDIERKKRNILSLGRISPVKNIHIFIEALNIIDKKNIDFVANIYGDSSGEDSEYYRKIRSWSDNLEKKGKVIFHGNIPNREVPVVYNQNEIFVNLTNSGSFDKTIIEAMCCESLVLVCNRSFEGLIENDFIFNENDPKDLAHKLSALFDFDDNKKDIYGKGLREYGRKHDLHVLLADLKEEMK